MSEALTFHPLLPATKAAGDAWSDFLRICDPRDPEDVAWREGLKAKYEALKANDPGALLNEAEECDRAVERGWSNLAQVAEELRAKAARLMMGEAA